MSWVSSHVPWSRMSPRARRFPASHRANARGASSAIAVRAPTRDLPIATLVGREKTGMPSASPRECAGSVETSRTRCPDRAAATARAAAQVVLPTPPLPPNRTRRQPACLDLIAFDVDSADSDVR